MEGGGRGIRPDGQLGGGGLADDDGEQQGLGGVEGDGGDRVAEGALLQLGAPGAEGARVDDDTVIVSAEGEDLHLGVPRETCDLTGGVVGTLETVLTSLQTLLHIDDLLQVHGG